MPTLAPIEDGWAACQVHDRGLVVALECPDAQVAMSFVTAGLKALDVVEKEHD